MDDVSLAGRTPDRRYFPIGASGLPRSGGEAGDRPNAGDFPWRERNGYSTDVMIVQ